MVVNMCAPLKGRLYQCVHFLKVKWLPFPTPAIHFSDLITVNTKYISLVLWARVGGDTLTHADIHIF